MAHDKPLVSRGMMSDLEENIEAEEKDVAAPVKAAVKPELPRDGNIDPKRSGGKPFPMVHLGDKVEIDPNVPVERYNNGHIRAYKAMPLKGDGVCFALICDKTLVPRHHKMSIYKSIVNQNIAQLVDAGPVYWPETKVERFALIYNDNMGKRLIKPGTSEALGLKQDVILDFVLPAFVRILQDFRDKDFVHGSIRATNLFASSDFSQFALGDCLSTPSGYFQSAAYETLERGMTDPIGRGQGTQATDLYALGVTLAALMRSTDPMQGLSQYDIVQQKYELGSYAAVTGKDRFTGSILELLRGLLNDNEDERWTIDDILAWIDGRRLTPKQSLKKIVAPRPIRLGTDKFYSPKMLAMSLEYHQTELRRIVDDGELKNWVVRSLEQPKLYEHVDAAIGQARALGQGAGYDERLASCISMAFDPAAPIRFRGGRLLPDGVGSALAEAYVKKGNLTLFAEMFAQGMVLNWVRAQTNPNVDVAGLVKKFDSCRNFIKQAKNGFGLERCLYTINSEAYCMSDKLSDYFVTSPEDVLYAYEDLCSKGKAPTLFIDRHVAAFLGVKDNKVIESAMADINHDEFYKQLLGNLKCFAMLQRRSQLPQFPHVAQAFAEQMNIIYKRYHDRKVRDMLKKNLSTFAAQGDLVKMSSLLENAEVQKKDLVGFRLAMQEYDSLRAEEARLNEKLQDPKKFGLKSGQEIAAVIACVISGIIIVTIGFMYLADQSVF